MFNFNRKLPKLLVAPSVALLLAAGCAQQPASSDAAPDVTQIPGSASAMPATSNVQIDNFTFTPATVTIPVGTTVTWVNHDDVPHTVTANQKAFASKTMDTDERYSHQFTAPGAYAYFCAVHPHMTGQVIVK